MNPSSPEPTAIASPATPSATCHGCHQVLYTASGGQQSDRRPHVRCSGLSRNIPMILGQHAKYLGNEVPDDCPNLASALNHHRGLTYR